MNRIDHIKAAIRNVPDFPSPGILFKDITPMLADPILFSDVVNLFAERHRESGIELVAGIESRGFLFGAAVAYALGAGMTLVRKKGKLPHQTIERAYDLEYGTATVEMHIDAVRPGERVLLMDDLLATGGTAAAAAHLIEQLGGHIVEVDFLIELAALNGREKLKEYKLFAPIVY